MDIIRLLSDSIANQIAAGEVVQRPASVVKELMENAIDADAANIQLIIKESGKTLIQVIDNGKGMSNTDARMCFERHATSKIKESADLFAIKTMGFRGEALASIAAVAQVELKSRRSEDELASVVKIESSEFKEQVFAQGPQGTSLLIKNLFYNVPARRNFLKSNPVEMKHILEEFQRIALAHPEVSFSLFHNDVEVYNLPVANLSKRIVDVLDKSYKGQMAKCSEDTPLVKISGYVGNPQIAAKRRGEQFFFVNKRFIKSSYLHHAVSSAFESTIATGSHPFYVLFLEIDPSHIDINIHPTKTEIKFDDEKAIYAILRSAVKQAIGVYNLTPSIDFESDINFANISTSMPDYMAKSRVSAIPNFEKSEYRPQENTTQKSNQNNWQKLFEGFRQPEDAPRPLEYENDEPQFFSSKANSIDEVAKQAKEGNDLSALQVHNKYILAQVKSGLMVIDQKNAYERIFYEQYLKELNSHVGFSQQLLFPKTLQLSPLEYQISLEIIDMVRNIGFNVEEFGHNTYIINGVPPQFMEDDEAQALKNIIGDFKNNENGSSSKKETMAKTLSKRAASKLEKEISKQEISALINKLFDTSMPSISPTGKPTLVILSLSKLAELILN